MPEQNSLETYWIHHIFSFSIFFSNKKIRVDSETEKYIDIIYFTAVQCLAQIFLIIICEQRSNYTLESGANNSFVFSYWSTTTEEYNFKVY